MAPSAGRGNRLPTPRHALRRGADDHRHAAAGDAERRGAQPLTAGVSYTRPAGVEHNVVNANAHEFVFIEIELK
jgi:hypothetical protein